MIAWFASFTGAVSLSDADRAWLVGLIAATPGLRRGLIYTPAQTHDPYLNDGPSPPLTLQLDFPTLTALEAALAPQGHLQALAQADALPSLRGSPVAQQAMLLRDFPVAASSFHIPPGTQACSYLVTYDGNAPDLNAWLHHYITHHTAVMARFPGIRQIEVATRLDWCGFLPWVRETCMLRNRVVFDTQAALTGALNSPVRHEMREDFQRFPLFTADVTHFPMATQSVLLR